MLDNNFAKLEAVALNLSQDGVPEWVQLIPSNGSIKGVDGRSWTFEDAPQLVTAFNSRNAELPIDVEHSTQIKGARGEAAPAVGWISKLETRDDGLWGQVAWNSAGVALLSNRSYRYLSPVFSYKPASKAITRMVSAGLTNNPNLDLVALNQADTTEETPDMKAILEALGLNSSATEADAVLAIQSMKETHATALNSASQVDPDKFVPKADYELAQSKIKTFETEASDREELAINTAVDAAVEAGKIAPSSKDYHIAACRANGVDNFEAAMKDAPKLTKESGLDGKDPDKKSDALSAEELAVCSQMGLSTEDFIKAKSEQGA